MPREIVKIDNLFNNSMKKLIDNETITLDKYLKNEQRNRNDKIIHNYSRVYLDDYFNNNRNQSKIIQIIESVLFTSVWSKYKGGEVLLNLIPYTNSHETQYTVYETGGEYNWHLDSYMDHGIGKDVPVKNRICNWIYYLNDDFDGGELNLCYDKNTEINNESDFNKVKIDMKITPKENTLVIMPSDMWHKVNPVTKGKRKTINGHIGFK
jgi:Rps23 Pro-64 3,4-dihydroxylase Tpa1-like proline 4-hydroxylase